MKQTLLSEDHVSLITALAECRDAFPIPAPGSPQEVAWGAAMGDPESVPLYVQACVAIAKAEAEALRLRLEIDPATSYDGIDCRDATIKALETDVEALREKVEALSLPRGMFEAGG